ncbi:MAG: ATP-binding protein [Bacilli bacterium]|nr:ATP-binding protein [Bacilli bacterium]
MITNFKVGGFKVFGDVVELNMIPKVKNYQGLTENLKEFSGEQSLKVLKTSIIYGGNNVGKSSLLNAIIMFKQIFKKGDLLNFPFEIYKNFCYSTDGIIKFEISFVTKKAGLITYGIEFANENNIGEYVFINDELLISRDLNENIEGSLCENKYYFEKIKDLKYSKLIVPYFLEYSKNTDDIMDYFLEISELFSRIRMIDNGAKAIPISFVVDFSKNKEKMNILNSLIKSTELYVVERTMMTEEEVVNNKMIQSIVKMDEFESDNYSEEKKERGKKILEYLKVSSKYKTVGGRTISKPSIFFDSVGTNKFVTLAMYIIDAMIENKILLIDEFDSSLHYKLTRALTIFMNSTEKSKAQFILTSHDVKLLSPRLFRKDQLNFIYRDDEIVSMVSLDTFKSNSEVDIRSKSNFEKMYLEEKIVPLPYTDISLVIEEYAKYEKKTTS